MSEVLNSWKIVLKDEVYNDLVYWLTVKKLLEEDPKLVGNFINGFLIYYEPYYREEVERFKKMKK